MSEQTKQETLEAYQDILARTDHRTLTGQKQQDRNIALARIHAARDPGTAIWIVVDQENPLRSIHRIKIGPHTLYLGDAYTIRPQLGWFDADVTDPPYAFNNLGGGKFRKERGASNRMIDEGLTEGFDHAIINPLLCGAVFVFCHNNQIVSLMSYLQGSFYRVVQCNWHKIAPSPMANKNYLADTETYFHAWQRGCEVVGNYAEKKRYVICAREHDARKRFDHDTVKPAGVMDKIMANVNGHTVCDPFMGTGSTGVAAIKAGKIFTGIEHNPKHFETAVRRVTAAFNEGNNT